MNSARFLRLVNGQAAAIADMPLLDIESFRSAVLENIHNGCRLASLFVYSDDSGRLILTALVAHDSHGHLAVTAAPVGRQYSALTPDCPAAHWFEREIAEQWGVTPQGHPWLKPLRFTASYQKTSAPGVLDGESLPKPGVVDYFRVEGAEIHEVAVGPVHAGIIEPGHFRFQCHGEDVLHLELALGYQHRGVERALLCMPALRAPHYAETLAGDTTAGHALAYSQLIEALCACRAPARAHAIRGIALELERLANHTGDLGALAGDIGYLPTASYCGRLRGDFLNMSALLCGSRFGRGLIRPGGVNFDLEPARARELEARMARAMRDTTGAVNLLWETNSVRARFEETGVLDAADARTLGMVGVPARACGLEMDVRRDHPTGIFRYFQTPVSTCHTGDVFARAFVRWLEIQRSASLIGDLITSLPPGSIKTGQTVDVLPANRFAVSLVEGWRGEICHIALTDAAGRLRLYKITDPSFHNWFGLALAMRGRQISDFPLCNKSFNLSYCGHDL